MAFFFLLFPLMTDLPASDSALLKAMYTATPGSNPEYAQGAIERNELAHREIAPFVWLIQVPAPASTNDWERRLNEAVAPEHGAFRVVEATAEEKRKIESGEITLQK